jgi:uncharacterized protein YgbK (DUF1537 family)
LSQPPLIVLDDDPTGAQAVRDVPVLLRWSAGAIAAAADGARAVHLLTNSRALPPERARALIEEAATEALEAFPDARLLLRGDSTLRAHLLEEYLAVCSALGGVRPPALLLVPALPAAGRITRDGRHLLVRDGSETPIADTEYARDAHLGYASSRLVDWAEERSGGFFRRELGREVHRAALRAPGTTALADACAAAAADGPAVVVPDAEDLDDLAAIARGLRAAQGAGVPVVVRAAPAFTAVLAGSLAGGRVPAPSAAAGVLVACGSHTEGTTRQLEALEVARPGTGVEIDVPAILGAGGSAEVERVARLASERLARTGVAVVSTPRARTDEVGSLERGERLARGVAAVVAAVSPRPAVVVTKGGITSAVVLREGLGAARARVEGPVVDGVALWRLEDGVRAGAACLVVPGNVGDGDLLVQLLRAMEPRMTTPC